MDKLKEGTAGKLHPALTLILMGIRAKREQGEAASAANLLSGLRNIGSREDFIPPPVPPDSTNEQLHYRALESEITKIAPSVQSEPQVKLLAAMPELVESGNTGNEESFRATFKTLGALLQTAYGGAAPVERVFIEPMLKAVQSIRPNRDPQAAYQKLTHQMIFTFLFLFGAMRKTGSDLSLGDLTSVEVTEIFDWCCPACPEPHTSEGLRKSEERFLRKTARRLSAAGLIKGNLGQPSAIEMRHHNHRHKDPALERKLQAAKTQNTTGNQ